MQANNVTVPAKYTV